MKACALHNLKNQDQVLLAILLQHNFAKKNSVLGINKKEFVPTQKTSRNQYKAKNHDYYNENDHDW